MKILLPSDGSDLSLDAVRHVLRLFEHGLRACLLLVNVQEPTHLYEVLMGADADAREGARRAAGAHALVPAAALLAAAGHAFETEVVSGDPAHALIEVAETRACDAIVMGTRGHGVLRGDGLGSVARAVLHGAGIAVTIVRHADAGSAGAEPPTGAGGEA